TMSTSSPSSPTMCTSADDCFCHEHERQSRSPNSAYAQRISSSAGIASTSAGARLSGSALTEQHLLESVGPQPEPERLERDDLLGRDVAEVDLRPELAHEPRLRFLCRRLEDQIGHVDRMCDLVDEPGAKLSAWPEDARGAALARLRDHL